MAQKVFDSHTHLPTAGYTGNRGMFKTATDAITYLKESGTSAALFNMWQGVLSQSEEDLDVGNRDALHLAQEYKGFLYPGAVIHPAYPDASRRWLQQFRDAGFHWVGELILEKIGIAYKDERFMTLFEECLRHNHVVQLHAHGDILEVAKAFPGLRIVCSHIASDLLECLAGCPNVWLDISGGRGGLWVGAIEEAYAAFGPDRLLYGTDFTGYEPRCFMARLNVAVRDEDHCERILHRNVEKLLGII